MRQPPAETAWAQSARLSFRFLFAAVAVAALFWAAGNIRTIPPESRAVVLRLGRVARVQGAGLLLAWPVPIEQVVLLPAAERQLQFPLTRLPPLAANPNGGNDPGLQPDSRQNAAYLLTGDGGVVRLGITLFYRIANPEAYMLARPHALAALERLAVASAVSLCAARDIDTLIVTRNADTLSDVERGQREQLRADLVAGINRRLDALAAQHAGIGIAVTRADLSAALPAQAEVAFDQVLTVTQMADQTMAEARTYAAQAEQQAGQNRDRILAEASAGAEERVGTAQTRTAAIAALAGADTGVPPAELLARLYYSRIGALLHRAAEVDAVDATGGLHLILPGAKP